MKNQFFADRRDFFKYDFLLALMEGAARFQRFTFIPMLTPNDGTSDGSLTEYPPGLHSRRQDLWNFLRGCLQCGERDIRKLRVYMKGKPFDYLPWRDDVYFTHAQRDVYFSGIPIATLKGALVFFDPDNGFEIPSMTMRNGDKYIRHNELAGVIERMDNSSAAVVYQHLPRKNRELYFAEAGSQIREQVGITDLFAVSDNVIAFFVAPKTTAFARVLKPVLSAYANEHGLKITDCT